MAVRYSDERALLADVFDLYGRLGWNEALGLMPEDLGMALDGSWYAVYAYAEGILIGTGRVVSDGALNAYICGLGVDEAHRRQGVGAHLFCMMREQCERHSLHVQFVCEDHLRPYYERLGAKKFAEGMTLD